MAKSDPPAPTVHFHVDQLEAKVKQENKPPQEVTVSSGDDRRGDLDFSAEVRDITGGGGQIDLQNPADGAAKAEPDLSFLDESVKAKLIRREPGKDERCPPKTGNDERARAADAIVFILLEKNQQELTNLRFNTILQPEKGKWGNQRSGDEIDLSNVDVCWAEVKEGEDQLGPTDRVGHKKVKALISPSEVKPFVLFIESQYDPNKFWWWLKWTIWPSREIPVKETNLSGHLIVKGDYNNSEMVQATLPLRLNRAAPGHEAAWYLSILSVSILVFIVATLFLFVRAKIAIRSSDDVNSLSDPLELEFKNRWVSNLTTAGAILGTILSAGVLPNDTYFMSKEHYIALNLFFGLVLVIATVGYQLFAKVWTFLLASAVTLGAGCGEVITVLLILKELRFQGSMPPLGVGITQLIVLISALVFSVMASFRAVGFVRNPPSAPTPDIYRLLGMLIRLKEEDKISEAEFNRKRTELLSRL